MGELVIGRTAVILKAEKVDVESLPIHHHPDEAGLMGAVHLAPAWMFKAFDAILGVDIGGTNIRAGVIALNLKTAPDLSKTKVWKFSLWRHGDEEGVKREHAVDALADMLKGLIAAARKKQVTGPLHRHWLSRHHYGRWLHRTRGAKFAGQLGKQQIQPSEVPAFPHR